MLVKQTDVIPALVSFLHILAIFFTLDLFLGATTKGQKKSIGFPDAELFMLNLLRKKIINKIKYSRSLSDPNFLGATISCDIISFRFLLISGHLRTTQENQNRSIK